MSSILTSNNKKRLQELLGIVPHVGAVVRVKNNGTVVLSKTNSFFGKLFTNFECDFLDVVKLISNRLSKNAEGQPIANFTQHQLVSLFDEFCTYGNKNKAVEELFILYLYGANPPKIRFKVNHKDNRVFELNHELLTYTTYDNGMVVEERQPIYHNVGSPELAALMNTRGVTTIIK